MQPNQADSEIDEEHLLNFVVNGLGDELPIDLGENVEVTRSYLPNPQNHPGPANVYPAGPLAHP